MHRTVSSDVVRTAMALRNSHPRAPALIVLDVCMRHRTGSLRDFGAEIEPATPFGMMLAEAFDDGSAGQDWRLYSDPKTPPAVAATLRSIWDAHILPKFANRYDLSL